VRSRAAALLAGLALAAAAPRAAPPPGECRAPRLASPGGNLAAVRCTEASGEAPRGAARLLFGLPIDLNRADPSALEVLPGIGPARAAAIVRERALRPFCAVDELDRVPGIGSTTRARLAAWVEAEPAAGCARP
jgi:competence protein ComEA